MTVKRYYTVSGAGNKKFEDNYDAIFNKKETYHIAIRVKQLMDNFMTQDSVKLWREYSKICVINKDTKERFNYVLSLTNDELTELVKESHVYFRRVYGEHTPYSKSES